MNELHLSQFSEYLKPREKEFHKGMAGHVLIVGGDYGFSGAPRLAAEGALRIGAGLVSVITRKEHALVMNVSRPEIMCHSDSDMKTMLERATVIGIGPGLGRSGWSRKLLSLALKSEKPLVIDADGLNILADMPVQQHSQWVLTPHPGEAARLLKKTTTDIQQNRVGAIIELQKNRGGVCVLKGAGTLILSTESMSICNAGNPGMATAGTGDVLTGVIAGLIAQQLPLAIAAQLGVLIHAMAGDLAAAKGERGMVASDLFLHLHKLVNRNHDHNI